jgi:hypothetical protein
MLNWRLNASLSDIESIDSEDDASSPTEQPIEKVEDTKKVLPQPQSQKSIKPYKIN